MTEHTMTLQQCVFQREYGTYGWTFQPVCYWNVWSNYVSHPRTYLKDVSSTQRIRRGERWLFATRTTNLMPGKCSAHTNITRTYFIIARVHRVRYRNIVFRLKTHPFCTANAHIRNIELRTNSRNNRFHSLNILSIRRNNNSFLSALLDALAWLSNVITKNLSWLSRF